jgi:hypothetical protein
MWPKDELMRSSMSFASKSPTATTKALAGE